MSTRIALIYTTKLKEVQDVAAIFITRFEDIFENFNPSRPDPGQREKINLNFYFHTSLWCLKRFYESLHKTF